MKLTVKKKVDVDGWFLKVFLGTTKWWKNEPFVFNGKEYHKYFTKQTRAYHKRFVQYNHNSTNAVENN